MIEISREVFKSDPVWMKLHNFILSIHKPAGHTQETLIKNKETPNFCQEARHFVIIDKFFIHYDVASWFKEPNGIYCVIDSIGIYDDFMEYEAARVKGIHSTSNSEGTNLN